jgi:hypothetical protein
MMVALVLQFKKAEGAMLKIVMQRKEFFERRPEDHPKYAEEWKIFWERRYKDLQQQGLDPNNHDFQVPTLLQSLNGRLYRYINVQYYSRC